MQFVDLRVRTAVRKACRASNGPPKPKHVRSIILKSFQGSIPSIYTELARYIQSPNPIQQLKAIITLHRLIRDGSPHLVGNYLTALTGIINRLVNSPMHANVYHAYQQITKHYLKYIQIRFVFHQKHPFFTGALTLPTNHSLPERYYCDESCLATLSYMMDLMDYLLVVPLPIIKNYWGDECKMDCTVPLILDSYNLYTLIVIFLNNLAHVNQNESVFVFLVQRFTRIFNGLEVLYAAARKAHYITSLICVPELPSTMPFFEVTAEQKQHYLKKHPHAISKNRVFEQEFSVADSHTHKSHSHRSNNHKTQERATALQQTATEFCTIFSRLLDLLTPPEATANDPEGKLEAMTSALMGEIGALERSTSPESVTLFEEHLYRTASSSAHLLRERNVKHCIQNNTQQVVLNTLCDFGESLKRVAPFCLKHGTLDGVATTVAEFMSFLTSSAQNPPPQSNVQEQPKQAPERNYLSLYDILDNTQPQTSTEFFAPDGLVGNTTSHQQNNEPLVMPPVPELSSELKQTIHHLSTKGESQQLFEDAVGFQTNKMDQDFSSSTASSPENQADISTSAHDLLFDVRADIPTQQPMSPCSVELSPGQTPSHHTCTEDEQTTQQVEFNTNETNEPTTPSRDMSTVKHAEFEKVIEQVEEIEGKMKHLDFSARGASTDVSQDLTSIPGLLAMFLKIAGECEQKRAGLGFGKTGSWYEKQTGKQNPMWYEGLLSAARNVVASFQQLYQFLDEGREAEAVIAALTQFNACVAQLVTAAKASFEADSPELLRLERVVAQILQTTHGATKRLKTPVAAPEETGPAAAPSKKEVFESQIRVLKLQKELEDAQNRLLRLRKEEYSK